MVVAVVVVVVVVVVVLVVGGEYVICVPVPQTLSPKFSNPES